ncbi:MAG: IS66 family insertion sequence element accessory protein TnpB, partial [Gammaproteobacteria bacterium]|nr:IS66 family insertion sequence element accessory protein TnpB [Gammaproteobacteria bacterium]
DKLKALYWDKTGFALWYKRLERDKFNWPRKDINGNRGSGLALPHRLIIVRQNDETTKHLGSRW